MLGEQKVDHYLDIRLIPDPEFRPTILMNALFAKLHRALAQLQSQRIAVSFPSVQAHPPALGDHLRLHGVAQELERLMALNWLTGMRDHTRISEPCPVPASAAHRVVRRVQAKSNPERLRRRRIQRHDTDETEVRASLPDSIAERLQLPFVTIHSQSTGQTFRLFIDHRPLGESAVEGLFSDYGLSPTATVPWF